MNNLAGIQKLSEKGKITVDRAELPVFIAASGEPVFVQDGLQTGESPDAVRIRLRLSLSIANSQVEIGPELGEPGVEGSAAHGGKGRISRRIEGRLGEGAGGLKVSAQTDGLKLEA